MPVLYPDRIGIWSVSFCEGGKPSQQSENRQQTQPTLLGDERYHHCAKPTLLTTYYNADSLS